jgi:cell division ATPase FtsA
MMRNLLDAAVLLKSRPLPERTGTNPGHYSLVDFGTDTVKAVVVRKERGGARVLGCGFAPAEGHNLGGGRAEVAVLAAAADGALEAAEDQTERMGPSKVVPDEALFCIPARLARGECFTVRQTRADPKSPIKVQEMKGAWERLERLARERLPLLGDDDGSWKPLALTPGVKTVDGHQVSDPVGLKGSELSLSAFGVAVWPSALRAAEAVAERLELGLVDVIAAPQALASVVPQRDAILLDVGAEGTCLHLIQHDALLATSWWPQGGNYFTKSLAGAFRCSLDEAEALKRAYADGALSEADHDLVARALAEPVAAWREALIARLGPMALEGSAHPPADELLNANHAGWLPGRLYLTGGGSLLADLAGALRALETVSALNFRRSLEIETLGPRLGARTPGQPALLDVPPHPLSDLLAPAISLATCLE